MVLYWLNILSKKKNTCTLSKKKTGFTDGEKSVSNEIGTTQPLNGEQNANSLVDTIRNHSVSPEPVQDSSQTCSNKQKEFLKTPPRDQKRPFSESSDDSSYTSPLPINKRNSWITPEKEELLKKLPHTLLGLKPAGRGKIKEVWEDSKMIKKRHSLQTTRIEVSKYYTHKKNSNSLEKKNVGGIKTNK